MGPPMSGGDTDPRPTAGALKNVKVLDLTRNLAGPFCTMILGDLGAEVIKVESPSGGDDTRHWIPPDWNGESPQFLAANRNKRSICVDLKSEAGAEIVTKLAEGADVLVESFRPGFLAMHRLGAEDLRRSNNGLIYCSISGFGSRGPQAALPGYDPVIQAYTGMMNLTGFPDHRPARLPIAAIDLGTGLWATIAIQAALAERAKNGRGSRIETSLYEVGVWWLSYLLAGLMASGVEPERQGTATAFLAPYEAFETAEGDIMICAGNDKLFRILVEVIEADHLARDPRFRRNIDRVQHRGVLHHEIQDRLVTRNARDWEALLRSRSFPCSRLRTLGELLEEELQAAHSLLRKMPHPAISDLRLVDMPVTLDERRSRSWTAPPTLGQHTDMVLEEIGLAPKQIEKLRSDGIVA
jgi:crotonobetainyl-CoA:carnitine CoA-transferase CaiB-like acyl-CoA transferase